ncbi:MAG: hypothetical protein LDL27_02260 [Desulfovibrio sp.]|nr:hypothetical protein [Desulfovibrio sp.]
MSCPNPDTAWHILALCHGDEKVLLHLLADSPCPSPDLANRLATLGCRLAGVAHGVEAKAYAARFPHSLTLTASFWTCNCERAYIHHVSAARCPRCEGVQTQPSQRRPSLDDLLAAGPSVN